MGATPAVIAHVNLPEGREGRLLASLVTLVALLLVWFALIAPLRDWYADRARALHDRQALAAHMQALVGRLPALRARAEAIAAAGSLAGGALIPGSSDAVASASIQERVVAAASAQGLTLSSSEALPASQAGAYRRVGVRVSIDAPFPPVIHLLEALETSHPSLLIDDLQMHGARLVGQSDDSPLTVAFTVLGFRQGAPAGRQPAPADTGAGE